MTTPHYRSLCTIFPHRSHRRYDLLAPLFRLDCMAQKGLRYVFSDNHNLQPLKVCRNSIFQAIYTFCVLTRYVQTITAVLINHTHIYVYTTAGYLGSSYTNSLFSIGNVCQIANIIGPVNTKLLESHFCIGVKPQHIKKSRKSTPKSKICEVQHENRANKRVSSLRGV